MIDFISVVSISAQSGLAKRLFINLMATYSGEFLIRRKLEMQAVIATGGKQYLVKEGDVVRVEKIDLEKGQDVEFDQVLMVEKEGKYLIGRPLVEKAKVTGKILAQDKAKKIIVFKYKSKKKYRKKTGHRQPFSDILIKKIDL